MGHHQLARVGHPVDDANSIFRAQATFAAAEAQPADAVAEVASLVSVRSLRGALEEGNPTKKHKS